MTDPISNLGRTATQLSTNSEKIKSQRPDDSAASLDKVNSSQNNDELILSEAAESSLANAEFDTEKVARIKEAIKEGNYPIDAVKVAESFASLERMISGN